MDRESLESMTVAQLTTQLKQRNLPSNGLKHDLIERMLRHIQADSEQQSENDNINELDNLVNNQHDDVDEESDNEKVETEVPSASSKPASPQAGAQTTTTSTSSTADEFDLYADVDTGLSAPADQSNDTRLMSRKRTATVDSDEEEEGQSDKRQKLSETQQKPLFNKETNKTEEQHDDNNQDGTSVYVENLPIPTSEAELQQVFGRYGSIRRIHIHTDKHSGRQLGYAFVKFECAEKAAAAIEGLNNYVMRSKAIRVRLAKPKGNSQLQRQQQQVNPLVQRQPELRNLYIANVPLTYTKVELDNTFGRFGLIEESKILFDLRTGASKGVGFVKFVHDESATKAMAEMTGKILEGATEPLAVRPAAGKKSQMQQHNTITHRSQQHPAFTPSNQQRFGQTTMQRVPVITPMTGISMMSNPAINMQMNPQLMMQMMQNPMLFNQMQQQMALQSQQPAFPAAAIIQTTPINTAMTGFNPLMAQGMQSVAGTQSNSAASNQRGDFPLFVLYLPSEVTEANLKELFELYGPVNKATICYDKQSGKPKGYGFVHMAYLRDAEEAVRFLDGHQAGGKRLKVQFREKK